jgi:phosphomannomutase
MAHLDYNSKTLKFSISGLRGIYGKDINPGNTTHLTKAFHQSIGKGKIAIAWDARPANKLLIQLTAATLSSLGREVHLLGMVPTPTIKHYVNVNKAAGGIMLSASHNPMEYVAFKLIGAKGLFFNDKQISSYRSHLDIENSSWDNVYKEGPIKEVPLDKVVKPHIKSVLRAIPLKKQQKLRIAIDPVGSCAINTASTFLKSLGYDVIAINDKVSGKFPRPPEPVPKALGKLCSTVKKFGCILGFAFDPDADRLAIVDEKGRAVGEEVTLALAINSKLSRMKRSSTVVVNLSTSASNQLIAQKFKGKLLQSAVGEANVLDVMLKRKAVLGGEGNGGVIDPAIASLGRDSLASMAYALEQVQRHKLPFSEIVKNNIPETYMVKKSIPATNQDIITELEKRLIKLFPQLKKRTIDGIHLQHPDILPWIHLRESNTEPIIRLILETREKKEADEILKLLKIL